MNDRRYILAAIPRILAHFAAFVVLTAVLFALLAAVPLQARFLFGNPPERMVWVLSSDPVPPTLRRIGPTQGRSMEPTLHEGDWLRCEFYVGQEILRGDVTIDEDGVCHRVTIVNATHVRTAGDASPRSDAWTAKARIRWIVRHVERPVAQPRLVAP